MNPALLDGLNPVVAAVYARYSSDLQRPTSIDDQVRNLRAEVAPYCAVPDGRVFTDDELSGSLRRRPGYQAMLAAARNGQFNVILFEAQDRIWRNQAEMHYALERFRFRGIRAIDIGTSADLTTPSGAILATVVGLKDELYLADLKGKIHRGMAGQIHRGLCVGGRAYGYHSEPIYHLTKKDHYGNPVIIGARRVIYDIEAKTVIYIFVLYVEEGSRRAPSPTV